MSLFYYFLWTHLWTPQRWRMRPFNYICRHTLHVIQFCLISSNHIRKYFRRCYRRRDLCRFNHPPSRFSGKRKQASQHMGTGWMKCIIHRSIEWHCIDGPTHNCQAALVKKSLQSKKKQATEITFQKRVACMYSSYSQEQGLTVKNILFNCSKEKYLY